MFRVVERLSGQAPSRRARRAWAVLLGVVVLLLAYVAFLPVMTVAAIFAIFVFSGEQAGTEGFDLVTVLVLVGSFMLALVLWRVGIRLIRGKRRLVLFLRKFGFTGASEALSMAVDAGVGRSWRLVTLDDHDIAPIGVSPGSRWAVRVLRLAFVVGAVALVVTGVRYVTGDSMAQIAEGVVDSAVANAQDTGSSEFVATLAGAFVGALVAGIVLIVVVGLLAVLIGVASTGGLLLSAVGSSARRAEKAKAVVVTRGRDAERLPAILQRRVRKVLAPRITVARVSDRLWQVVVQRLAGVSDAVLVDVSFPTDNLVWEINALESTRAAWIPVGRLDRLQALTVAGDAPSRHLREILRDREVLAYAPEDLDSFSKGLRRSLDILLARRS